MQWCMETEWNGSGMKWNGMRMVEWKWYEMAEVETR